MKKLHKIKLRHKHTLLVNEGRISDALDFYDEQDADEQSVLFGRMFQSLRHSVIADNLINEAYEQLGLSIKTYKGLESLSEGNIKITNFQNRLLTLSESQNKQVQIDADQALILSNLVPESDYKMGQARPKTIKQEARYAIIRANSAYNQKDNKRAVDLLSENITRRPRSQIYFRLLATNNAHLSQHFAASDAMSKALSNRNELCHDFFEDPPTFLMKCFLFTARAITRLLSLFIPLDTLDQFRQFLKKQRLQWF